MAVDLIAQDMAGQALELAAGAKAAAAITFGAQWAVLGDSIAAQNSVNGTSSTYAYQNKGFMSWFRFLSGGRVDFPLANNFGVGGDTLAMIAVRVPNVLLTTARVVVFEGGTNDLTLGTPFASMQATAAGIIRDLTVAGRTVIAVPITPRSGLSTTQLRVMSRYNTWLKELCLGRPDLMSAAGLANYRPPLVMDFWPYLADMTTASSPITGQTQDGLHPAALGAFWMGQAMLDTFAYLLPPRPTSEYMSGSFYDAALNPSGQLLRSGTTSLGLLAGTGGTLTGSTGFTPTGSVATGWTLVRTAGTSTMAVVASKQNPRTDYPFTTGERQRLQITVSGAGGVNEGCKLTIGANGSDIAVGDQVVFQVDVEIASSANLLGVQAVVSNVGGSAVFGIDGSVVPTDTVLGILPNRSIKGTLRTPPFTLPSGTTNVSVSLTPLFKTDGGSASADIYFSDAKLFKVGV